ncbi:rabenosyn-5 isoform X2 [Glossina fuscipes]|uniref:Rabenosyn-5 isoform X2 n=1 Tax=Glossina fuscipes TaxID=7396 RepID=A0A9C6DV88_9MUSC|nr:rabenosyn-5 isoform X2 [Glossina fuscipes]
MSNPFGEPDCEIVNGEILEGFLCPICHEDLKSLEFLTEHFEKTHAEEQDVLKSIFKDIFSKAKKKIKLNLDEKFDFSRNSDKSIALTSRIEETTVSTTNVRTRLNIYNFMDQQKEGVERSHIDYFQTVRNPRLERYASETNKLVIRLHKLVKDMPTDALLRKKHDQNIVPWLDGRSVKLCPNCAKSFHIARRQHHCRLCGSIMCQECSKFLSLASAMELASLTTAYSDSSKQPIISSGSTTSDLQRNGSLYEGESILTLSDASALRGKIGQIAEAIDVHSKRILSLPCEQGSREESLKKSIRLSCIQLIKEKMLSLPPLPQEDEIRKIQDRKRIETEQRIASERKMAMEAYERYGLAVSTNTQKNTEYVQGCDLRSLDNWSARPVSTAGRTQNNDPLVEQINIIKGYIKQARQDMNFDVVETLETNLRELQKEFYERQKPLRQSNETENNKSRMDDH